MLDTTFLYRVIVITITIIVSGALIIFFTLAIYKFHCFDYPVSTNMINNPLEYYIKSDNLFGISLSENKLSKKVHFDENNLPMREYRNLGIYYNPAYIAWWAIINLEEYVKNDDVNYLENFYSSIHWLCENCIETERGFVIWPYNFDWKEGKSILKAPWFSALAQGLAISVLVRAYLLSGNIKLLELAKKGTKVYEVEVKNGGIKTLKDGYVFYEEYPSYPLARVLDGFIFSLLGLYDYYRVSKDLEVKKLFEDGYKALTNNIEYWNYNDRWSWYGSHGNLSSPMYNKLNSCLLLAMYNITKDTYLKKIALSWAPEKLNGIEKIKLWIYYYYLLLRRIIRIPITR